MTMSGMAEPPRTIIIPCICIELSPLNLFFITDGFPDRIFESTKVIDDKLSL